MLTVLIIGGRTQSEGRMNGCLELEEILHQALGEAGYTSMQVRVRFVPWYADWRDIASRLGETTRRYRSAPFGIVVCAFSRGVGYGVVNLGKYLPMHNLKINALVSSDGI